MRVPNSGSFKPTHGFSRKIKGRPTREYSTWTSMRNRCKPDSPKAHLYADRGVNVCERWNSFDNFLSDMGPRPQGKTLDRIDVNGDYSPENCRWATPKEQGNNRRIVTDLQRQLDAYKAKYGPLEV